MSVFFIVSGMNLDVKSLATVGVVGVSYFVIRILGKYLGTYVSCALTGTSREIRNYMGLALIPQAGVAIGLAFLGQRLLPPETGKLMLTIILSSSVLYEMVGPVSAKMALLLSGSISRKDILNKMEEDRKEAGDGDGYEKEMAGGGSDRVDSDCVDRDCVDSDCVDNDCVDSDCVGSDCVDSDCIDRDCVNSEYEDIDGEDKEDEELAEDDVEHAMTRHIQEMSQGVDEQDEFDIESEVLPEKPVEKQEKCKKNGKGKKQGKKK